MASRLLHSTLYKQFSCQCLKKHADIAVLLKRIHFLDKAPRTPKTQSKRVIHFALHFAKISSDNCLQIGNFAHYASFWDYIPNLYI